MLPWELVELIAADWNGRRLGMTCRRLAKQLNLDKYVRVDHITLGDGRTISMSRLPSGIFHGISSAKTVIDECARTDIVTYNRGRIVSSAYHEYDFPQPLIFDVLIDGWICTWETEVIFMTFHHNRDGFSIGTCRFDEIESRAHAWIGGIGVTGESTCLNIANEFAIDYLPNVVYAYA